MESNTDTLKSKFLDTVKQIKTRLKYKNKLKIKLQDTLPFSVIGNNIKVKELEKAWNNFHYRYKNRFLMILVPIVEFFMYLFLKLNKKIIGKTWIEPNKIDKINYNKTITAWNNAIDKCCKDSVLLLQKRTVNPESVHYVKFVRLVNGILMQGILLDTFYRGLFDVFGIYFAREMQEQYKDDDIKILFNKKSLNDIDFWMATQRNDGNHIVLNVGEDLIVVPKGQAVRLTKQDVNRIYEDLNKEKK